jgi:hypothetical protein
MRLVGETGCGSLLPYMFRVGRQTVAFMRRFWILGLGRSRSFTGVPNRTDIFWKRSKRRNFSTAGRLFSDLTERILVSRDASTLPTLVPAPRCRPAHFGASVLSHIQSDCEPPAQAVNRSITTFAVHKRASGKRLRRVTDRE